MKEYPLTQIDSPEEEAPGEVGAKGAPGEDPLSPNGQETKASAPPEQPHVPMDTGETGGGSEASETPMGEAEGGPIPPCCKKAKQTARPAPY